MYRLSVDAYSLQHPEQFMVSSRSAAMHLAGMYWSMEQERSLNLPAPLKRWVDGPRRYAWVQPPPAGDRGPLTVLSVTDTDDVARYERVVVAWAESAWGHRLHTGTKPTFGSRRLSPRPSATLAKAGTSLFSVRCPRTMENLPAGSNSASPSLYAGFSSMTGAPSNGSGQRYDPYSFRAARRPNARGHWSRRCPHARDVSAGAVGAARCERLRPRPAATPR